MKPSQPSATALTRSPVRPNVRYSIGRQNSLFCLRSSTKRSIRCICAGMSMFCGQCGTHWLQPDAMVGLPQARHRTVVPHQKGAPCLPVGAVARRRGHPSFVDALVEVEQNARDVEPVGAGHAVLAVVARNGRVAQQCLRRLFEEFAVGVGQLVERREGAQVVLQVLHVGHAAQYGQHAGKRSREAEGPRSDALLGAALAEFGGDVVVYVRQASAQQRFHDDGRNAARLSSP